MRTKTFKTYSNFVFKYVIGICVSWKNKTGKKNQQGYFQATSVYI